MKKLFSLLAAAALAASVAPAWAEGGAQQQQQRAQPGAQFRGQHVMQGKITNIDRDKSTVKLDTSQGEVELYFPPASLQGLNEGDTVDVQLAIKPAPGQQKQQGGQQGQQR